MIPHAETRSWEIHAARCCMRISISLYFKSKKYWLITRGNCPIAVCVPMPPAEDMNWYIVRVLSVRKIFTTSIL